MSRGGRTGSVVLGGPLPKAGWHGEARGPAGGGAPKDRECGAWGPLPKAGWHGEARNPAGGGAPRDWWRGAWGPLPEKGCAVQQGGGFRDSGTGGARCLGLSPKTRQALAGRGHLGTVFRPHLEKRSPPPALSLPSPLGREGGTDGIRGNKHQRRDGRLGGPPGALVPQAQRGRALPECTQRWPKACQPCVFGGEMTRNIGSASHVTRVAVDGKRLGGRPVRRLLDERMIQEGGAVPRDWGMRAGGGVSAEVGGGMGWRGMGRRVSAEVGGNIYLGS